MARCLKYVTLLLVIFIILFMYNMPVVNHRSKSVIDDLLGEDHQQNTKKFCSIPSLNPWDPSVMPYYERLPPLRCKRFQPELTYMTSTGWLYINESVVKNEQLSAVLCRYRCFDRSEGFDDNTLNFTDWTDFSNATFVQCGEFVEVTCRKNNSFPNALAFLAGKRVETSPGEKSEVPEDVGGEFFDDWPLIWKSYSRRGYITLFAEDMPSLGLFSYGMKGFRFRPTDHYLRPFWLKVWKSFLHLRSTHLCIGNTPTHRFQLHYLLDFLQKYQGSQTFVLSWLSEITHDWLNQGQVADKDLADFFTRIHPYLNNSITFVFADHGQRFSSIRQTVAGRLEENMPLFTIALPDWVQRRYSNLKSVLDQNSRLLITHFDLYATLRHIYQSGSWEQLAEGTSLSAPPTRSISIFHRISSTRTCDEAGVPIYYCICQREVAVDTDNALVQRAGLVVVQHLNHLLDDLRNSCAIITLKKIRRASQLKPPVLSVRSKWWLMLYKSIINDRVSSDQKHFIVQIEVAP
ncbi:unnamed protein product, partial [Soboliphyme baturini]|uniref:Uncharacterized protein n=1 Tax=Soboliphyme baturini TaxID=241478 RepID=A0A183ILZ5_9BILA